MIDIKKVQEEAQKEYQDEKQEAAKRKVKQKMKEIDAARLILRNLERELQDLYESLGS